MMRLWLFLCSVALIFTVVGCGGSSTPGGTTGSGGGTPPSTPTLTAIAPSSSLAGASGIQLIAFGKNFGDFPSISWNGTAISTQCVDENLSPVTCTGATELSATIPPTDLATAGTAKVSVVSGDTGGGTSNAMTFTIVTQGASQATWARAVAGITSPNDIVSDSLRGKLYVSVSSSDTAHPDTVAVIDPVGGAVTSQVPASSNPYQLSLSSDGSYLWVGLDGSYSVERLLLPSLSTDISFPLPMGGTYQQQAVALEAAPVNPHTVALIAGERGWSPAGNGVYVYDDSVQRASSVPGFMNSGLMIDWMQWGKDDSVLYGNQYTTIDAGGIATMPVTPAGVTLQSYRGGLVLQPSITHFERSNGLLYSYGGAYDPSKPTLVGSFDLPVTGGEACTDDTTLNRYYCVTTYSEGGTDVTAFELWVFDLTSYALVDRVFFGTSSESSSSSSVTGIPYWLVRWGNAGLALISISDIYYGNGGVYLIDGAAVNPNATPDSSAGSPADGSYAWMSSMSPQAASASSGLVSVTIKGRGFSPASTACWSCNYIQFRYLPTTYVSSSELTVTLPVSELPTDQPLEISVFDSNTNLFSSNALTFTVQPASSASTQVTPINLCGTSMVWDATTQLLYVGTADYDGFYPNAVVALDPSKGTVVKAQTVGADPIFLSDSAGGEFLYAAYANSTNLTQLALPSLNLGVTGVLSNPPGTAWLPGDMKAAPVDPHAVAATLIMPGFDPEALGGVAIYDDGVPRPDTLAGWTGGQTVPATYDTLAWGASDTILAAAGSSWDEGGGWGPLYSLGVDSSGVSYLASGTSAFNTTGGYIHSDFGTGLIYSDDGTVADPQTTAIVGTYNASGLVVPDSSLNRVFILGQTAAQAGSENFTIESFDQKTFAMVSSITLNALSGNPIELARWGTSGLAVLTTGGEGDVLENGFGMLYLISDTTFVSNLKPANAAQSTHEPVQVRWKQLTKREMLKNIHQRMQAAGRPQAALQR